MRKCLLAMVLVAVLAVAGVVSASAGVVHLVPFEIWSEDEAYVFRFEPSEGGVDYAQAAVYRGEEQIYMVEGLRYASPHSLFFSQDLRHFAFMPPLEHNIALQFYSEGVLTRTYYIEDLVRNMRRTRRMSSGTVWMGETSCEVYVRRHSVDLLAEYDQLVITTVDGITHTFDITTAEVASEMPFPIFWTVFAAVAGAGVIAGIIFVRKRYAHKK